MALSKETIDKLIGKDVKDISYWEEKYPLRPNNQVTTRVAPSPTGFQHIGAIFQAVMNRKFAHQNNGVFFLRIEDTDTKREVSGATDLIISSFEDFDISPDEGPLDEKGNEKGAYAPYFQSKRADLYKSGIKYFLENDLAYPCFCTEDDIENIRKEQTILKVRPGYYGKWARCRRLSEEQIEKKLEESCPFIIRFKANGNWDNKKYFEDLARGKVLMPENDLDIVIMKKDGLPTYHFAHLMDDHFMRTTHVIRADEWLASLPLHIQLFEAIGWTPPHYVHTAPIQKLDEGNRRKLSKRKDPEAGVTYYFEQGYPIEAVKEYIMNLANSNFEDFKKANPENALDNFEFKIENLNNSGALLDFKKLENISKEFIATLSSDKLFARLYAWAETYDQGLKSKMDENKDYIKSILAIERDGCEKVRKDFYIFSKMWDEISYFFDDAFTLTKEKAVETIGLKEEDIKAFLSAYLPTYNHEHSKDDWFANLKEIALSQGYAKNAKEKDKEPGKYKGTISDAAKILRVSLTGRTESPDMYAIMQILGKDKTLKRLSLV